MAATNRRSRFFNTGERIDAIPHFDHLGDESAGEKKSVSGSESPDASILVQNVPLHTSVRLKTSHSYKIPSHVEAKKGHKEKLDEEHLQLELEAAKLKDIRVKDQIERIEYNRFPSILGWYFDGTFSSPFKLNELYAEYFSEVEEEMELKRDLLIHESFAEKVSRNFWPPKWIGQFFRTRGVYLDLKELREDPPRTPPDCSMPGDDARTRYGMDYGTASGRKVGDLRDKWYWTDELRDFKFKDDDERYQWWEEDGVWRIRESEEKSPYAWYWNPKEGKFCERDKMRPDLYNFEQHDYIYVAKHIFGPSENGLSPSDYFYCEIKNRWIPLQDSVQGEVEYYVNGRRNIRKGPRPKNGHGPDDFFYSADSGLMELKDSANPIDYHYDRTDRVFKKHGDPYGPGKSGLYPTDYVYSEKNGVYLPKNPKELYKPSPYDWYFDDALGRFYHRDKTILDDYEFDQAHVIWRLKDAKGPSANGLGPDEYAYDEVTHEWKLLNAIPPEDLKQHPYTKRHIVQGFRGTSGHKDDDYYYDSLEGKFLLKDLKELDAYYFQGAKGIFRKKGQSFGPGKSQHYAKDYYFDEVEGAWLLTQHAKAKSAKLRVGPKLLRTLYKTPYDYAFDCKDGVFVLRDPKNPSTYEFNAEYAVYVRKGSKYRGPSTNGKTPTDYYFDENEFNWYPIDEVPAEDLETQIILYPNAKRFIRLGVRGVSGKIADDFYFHDGIYSEKDPETPDSYRYDYLDGVWRLAGMGEKQIDTLKKPYDYFFSHEEGKFYLKKDLKYHQYIYDGNPPLYIQTFRAPDDYYWDGGCYVLKPPIVYSEADKNGPSMRLGKGKKKRRGKKGKKGTSGDDGDGGGGGGGGGADDGLKDYNRPWLHNYVYQASDRIRFVQELDKIREREKIEADKTKKANTKSEPKVSKSSVKSTTTTAGPKSAKPKKSVKLKK